MAATRCDLCEHPARYHETIVQDGVVTERHLCGIHGSRPWFTALKGIMLRQIDQLPAGWLPAELTPEQFKRRISEAQSLPQNRTRFKPR